MLDAVNDGVKPVVGGDGAGGVELLYTPAESIFGAAAPLMAANGWSLFPQETLGDRRLPGKVFGSVIKWGEDGENLKNVRPSADKLDLWCKHCATLNVACVFGPASGHTFAIDIDVLDEKMVGEIVAIADEILGYTPLRREGRAPKVALIYRHGDGENDRVPSGSRFFAAVDANGNATKSEHGLEILGAGKPITFHGRHHKTGNYFKWLDANPMLVGPEAAPLVTPDQVKTFLEAVDARWRFHRGSAFSQEGVTWQWDETSSMMVPKLALAAGGTAWQEDENGIVVDGREAYLTSLVYRTVTGNYNRLMTAREVGRDALEGFRREAAKTVADLFQRTAQMDGKWNVSEVRRNVVGKVNHLVAKVLEGRVAIRQPSAEPRRGDQAFSMPQATGGDPELSFLKPNKQGIRAQLRGHVEPRPEGAPDLSIPEDRSHITTMVQEGLQRAFESFFSDVYGDADGEGKRVWLHILKAPTGAGKTSRGIRFIAADPRTKLPYAYVDENGEEREGGCPIVMLLPTYNNIDELRHRAQVLNLDGSLSDADLRKAAEGMGLIAEDELDGKLAELRRDALNCGLETMVYRGKLKAGCMVAEKVSMAMAAGIGTAAFCKTAKKNEDGTVEDEFCEHYAACPAIKQRAEIAKAHVVFMPHSFLALAIPEELKNVRCVVADERIHHLFLHTATFSALSLTIARKKPRLTKREVELGVTAEDLLAERDMAARIALDALRHGECPAEALVKYENPSANYDHDRHPGPIYVQSAIRVCGNAIQRDGTLSPSMPIEEVRALCEQPTGKDIREEHRFWKIISERVEALTKDEMRRRAVANLRREIASFQGDHDFARRERLERSLEARLAEPRSAPGARDHRIQLLTDAQANGGTSEVIRISWRTDPNWLGRPMLLLDASAAPPVIAKIWKMREDDIVVHDIVEDTGRSLNVKIVGVVNQTFSNASLIASPSASPFEKQAAAQNLARVRQALSTVAGLYGDGRVVAGTSIVLRKVINNGWVGPDNVDWCHYGAMRGLDMFKFHGAAFSVGRMEVPVRTIDGIAAALTYDDPVPEPPFDVRGDGMDPQNPSQSLRLPMGDQRLRLRSGHVAVIPVPMVPGKWGRLVQRQYREEELLQFVGRLRPVYREGRTPVWFALSSVIPEELIVDELIHINDLLFGVAHVWEGARRTDGVVDPEVLAAACPDLFKSAEAAASAMEQLGFDLINGAIAARPARGHAVLSWRPHGGGEPRFSFVRGSIQNPEARLREVVRKVLKLEVEVRVISTPQATLARERQQDSVEQAIGPRHQRIEKESSRRWNIGKQLFNSEVMVEQKVSIHQYAMPDWARKLTLSDIDALHAIEDHWRAKAGIEDDRVMPVLPDGPLAVVEDAEYASYDQLGATIRDADGPLRAAP